MRFEEIKILKIKKDNLRLIQLINNLPDSEELIKTSKNSKDLLNRILNNDDYKLSYEYANISKCVDCHNYTAYPHCFRLRQHLEWAGLEKHQIYTGNNRIKLGSINNPLYITVSVNGKIYIYIAGCDKKDCVNSDMLHFSRTLSGKYPLYNSDLGDDAVTVLDGDYKAYQYGDIILFLQK